MIVQTAFIKCRIEDAQKVEAALIEVADHVGENEPDTTDYVVLRSDTDAAGTLFTTLEYFRNELAMELHNNSAAVARFFEVAGPLLTEPATVILNKQITRAKNLRT